MSQTAAFYCVADSRYFLGAVALLNSLRLVGHQEPLFVLDSGLEPGQRELLAPCVTLVPTRAESAGARELLKAAAPLRYPADLMAMLDTDMIVTRPLTLLLERAAEGKVVAFADRVNRFHSEWGELLDLGPSRRQTYVNSGLLVLPGELGTELLELVSARMLRIDLGQTGRYGKGARGPCTSYPFYHRDQDVWNAVLATRARIDQLEILDHRLAPFPPFTGLTLIDAATLDCRYPDGAQPFLLHYVGRYKPWLAATRTSIYTRLLERLLLAPDVQVVLAAEQLPLRLRPGSLAWAERRRAAVVAAARGQRGRPGLRRQLARWRYSRTAS